MKKVVILFFGLISYVVFFAAFLYAIGFVGNLWVPKGIDSGVAGENPMLVNVLLLSVFAIQHSVMARPKFKDWWTKLSLTMRKIKTNHLPLYRFQTKSGKRRSKTETEIHYFTLLSCIH